MTAHERSSLTRGGIPRPELCLERINPVLASRSDYGIPRPRHSGVYLANVDLLGRWLANLQYYASTVLVLYSHQTRRCDVR